MLWHCIEEAKVVRHFKLAVMVALHLLHLDIEGVNCLLMGGVEEVVMQLVYGLD